MVRVKKDVIGLKDSALTWRRCTDFEKIRKLLLFENLEKM